MNAGKRSGPWIGFVTSQNILMLVRHENVYGVFATEEGNAGRVIVCGDRTEDVEVSLSEAYEIMEIMYSGDNDQTAEFNQQFERMRKSSPEEDL